jgi:signal transduction histidine kinase
MNYIHAVDVALALIATLINVSFILLVLTRTSREPLYITFLSSCLAVAVWNFGDFMCDIPGVGFWFYFSLIGTSMIPAVMFHFGGILVRPARKKLWTILPYILCIPLALCSLLVLYSSRIRAFVDSDYWNAYYFLLLGPLFTVGAVKLFEAIQKSQSKNEKSRLRYVLIAVCIACFAGATDLIQIYKKKYPILEPIPPLGHLGSVIYTSILAIGVFKHRSAYDLVAAMRTKLDVLNELAAGIAHELRNPLSSIKGAANLLQDRYNDLTADESREYLCLVSEEVERLDGLLANYRSLMRPLKIEKESTRINAVIEKTVALMKMNANAPKIELNLSPEALVCQSDPQMLRQVFINLIKNAFEACGPEGTLYIVTKRIPPSVLIVFTDTGKGIPAEMLANIFEPFVSTKANGMGLGLAICKRLIDLNGGTIEASNVKGGASFIIRLPAEVEQIAHR